MFDIPYDLLLRLHKTLLRCGSFVSDHALQAIFVDSRLSQWKAGLPEATSDAERVRLTVEYLSEKRNVSGENGLVLLLYVLCDQTPPTDASHHELAQLANELEQYVPTPATPQWDAALTRYREWVKRTYGTMRVLGKHEPVSVEGIYTDVYLLEQPAALRYAGLNDLSSEKKGKRLDGLELVKQLDTQTLVILGKPGAGKTTFLKHIALQATAGQLDDHVPFFVALREWADDDDLLDILTESFVGCGLANPKNYVEHLLQAGQALLLFDALDEMSEQARSTFIKMLERFNHRYLDCNILLTYRTAVTPYQFERAKTVEVADFTDEQMRTFAANWFGEDMTKTENFRRQIEQDKRLRDLGRTPLLLGMLCLTFDERGDFPQKRADLYRQALDTLLVQWDESRNIERDAMRQTEVYHGLALGRKHQLFAYIAYATFEQGETLIPKERLERLLTDYLVTIPNAPARIDIDSAAILKAIEAQHGILVEHAHGIYAFLHPIFQEYYTAYYVVTQAENGDTEAIPHLLTSVHEDRWREVILLTSSLLDITDDFFENFLMVLAALIPQDLNLWELINVSKYQAEKVMIQDKKAVAMRALYFLLNYAFVSGNDDTDIKDINNTYEIGSYLDYSEFSFLHGIADFFLDLRRIFEFIPWLKVAWGEIDPYDDYGYTTYRSEEHITLLAIRDASDFIEKMVKTVPPTDYNIDILIILVILYCEVIDEEYFQGEYITNNLDEIITFIKSASLPQLYVALASIPLPKFNTSTESWKTFGNRLTDIAIEHRHFHPRYCYKQFKKTGQYLYITQLLTGCLAVANISDADRAAIEDRLLLPPGYTGRA
ncbi:MAG: NACHT domain-containing protein [Anaerolineae bacterium]|nr:NACHT domain-containing protein [Anaerolineae bacterium]